MTLQFMTLEIRSECTALIKSWFVEKACMGARTKVSHIVCLLDQDSCYPQHSCFA